MQDKHTHVARVAARTLAAPGTPEVAEQFVRDCWTGPDGQVILRCRSAPRPYGWQLWDGTAWIPQPPEAIRLRAWSCTDGAAFADRAGRLRGWSPTETKIARLLGHTARLVGSGRSWRKGPRLTPLVPKNA
jgi:hypothetical protein